MRTPPTAGPLALLLALWSWLAIISSVMAGFDSNGSNNLAIYWGQNSHHQGSGEFAQQRLAHYCEDDNPTIIPLAFVHTIVNPTQVNFANAGDNCTSFPGTTLLQCPEIEEDIKTCQANGKTILLSLGGATYTEGGFQSEADAVAAADKLWAMFGPPPPPAANADNIATGTATAHPRPFGDATIDGFDFDFEATVANLNPFARRLRSLMDAAEQQQQQQPSTPAGGRTKFYYLSAAPQCPFPDQAMDPALSGPSAVRFDFVMVQFYNNWCGVQNFKTGDGVEQAAFNFAQWDAWALNASSVSDRPVKVLLGVPGSETAGNGYQAGPSLATIITYCKRFASFGGVMIWDMSQTYANLGFMDSVVGALAVKDGDVGAGGGAGSGPGQPEASASASPSYTYTSTTATVTVVPPGQGGETTTTTTTTSTVWHWETFTIPSSMSTGGRPPVEPISTPSATPTLSRPPVEPITTAPPAQATTGAGFAHHWNQCGGIGYQGPTVCEPPYTCKVSNEWWAACL